MWANLVSFFKRQYPNVTSDSKLYSVTVTRNNIQHIAVLHVSWEYRTFSYSLNFMNLSWLVTWDKIN